VRLIVIGALVALGFLPYAHEVGGPCHAVPRAEEGVRAVIADEITEVHVREGDVVEAGDLIVCLAARDERSDVEKSRAELARAQADLALLEAGTRAEDLALAEREVELRRIELDFAERELKRQLSLMEKGDAGIEDVEAAQATHDAAVQQQRIATLSLDKARNGPRPEEIRAAAAEVDRLAATLAHQEELLALREITARIAGRIATPGIDLKLGQSVEPGDLIVVIQDTSAMHVELWADEPAAALIRPGMPVAVRFEAFYGRLIHGTVRQLAPAAEEEMDLELDRFRSDRETLIQRTDRRERQRYVRVLVDLHEQPEGLCPGMSGYAKVVVDSDRVLWEALWRAMLRFVRVDVWSWLP
jgi:multidrug resistance efflux pump